MNDWIWAAAALESYAAIGLLLIASLVLWRRLASTYFLIGGIGFFIGLLGALYRSYVVSYAGVLCPSSVEKMPEFLACANLHVAYGSVLAATGLVTAGVAFLLYAIKKPRQ
ncbi:MAG TPA: hypothetical protein VK572_09880 [Burkholderiales bacterium]|nr:hypothetical protein [Burkholderiales bacterium]